MPELYNQLLLSILEQFPEGMKQKDHARMALANEFGVTLSNLIP